MKFFLDTADIEAIEHFHSLGFLDGVTTNPSLVSKTNTPFVDLIKRICDIVPGPVSAEVIATLADEMIEEGLKLSKIASNVTIKVPLTFDGLRACHTLRQEGIMVNVTLCFQPAQALLAAKAGATFISPFIGRLDDIGHDGMTLIQEIKEIYLNYPSFHTQILAASIRTPSHVIQAARLGADIVTLPPSVLNSLVTHPLTDKGIASFLKDWEKTGQSI